MNKEGLGWALGLREEPSVWKEEQGVAWLGESWARI